MTVAIIIAKKDSTRIPNKNMKLFCGLPLVGWSIKQAINSHEVDKVIVSTDGDEIEEFSSQLGAIVVRRPHEYTLMQGGRAFKHVTDSIRLGLIRQIPKINTAVFMLPTSPVRLPDDIDNMVRKYRKDGERRRCLVVRDQLETIVYKKDGDEISPVIFDKNFGYAHDGGGMHCETPEWHDNLMELAPAMDEDHDKDPMKYQTPVELGYFLKEWQFPELDLPEHWSVAESVMIEYILSPLGYDCYEKYGRRRVVERNHQ